jgi:hypothetical protein
MNADNSNNNEQQIQENICNDEFEKNNKEFLVGKEAVI